MPRQATRQVSLLGAPTPSLMAAEGPGPSLMAVSATPVELSVYQGDDKRWLFRLKQTGGAPFDLTDYTAAMQFRTDFADVAVVFVDTETTIPTPANGEVVVTLPSESSTLMTAPSYKWDLEITRTFDDWTTTIAVGTLTVTKEVTRLS